MIEKNFRTVFNILLGVLWLLGTFGVFMLDIAWFIFLVFGAILLNNKEYGELVRKNGVTASSKIKKDESNILDVVSKYISYFILFLFVASWFSDIEFYMPYLYFIYILIGFATVLIADMAFKEDQKKAGENV